jgi:hypothetical protein
MVKWTAIAIGTLALAGVTALALYVYLYVSTLVIENTNSQPVLVTAFIKYGYETAQIAEARLEPHQSLSRHFVIKSDGEIWLTCRALPDGKPISQNFGYVTEGIAMHYRFTIVTCADIKVNITP